MRRRAVLGTAAALLAATAARGHGELGPVTPPRALPGLRLTLHDGRQLPMATLLAGRLTALQLMFTGCSAVCPIQGAVFAALQAQVLGRVPDAQLLSLSIDPLNDDARALAAWRQRLGAQPGWLAAAPPLADGDVMLDALAARARGSDRHSAQVVLIDRRGRLAFRCAELAAPRDIARAMGELSRLG